jgi:hypothetical protein
MGHMSLSRPEGSKFWSLGGRPTLENACDHLWDRNICFLRLQDVPRIPVSPHRDSTFLSIQPPDVSIMLSSPISHPPSLVPYLHKIMAMPRPTYHSHPIIPPLTSTTDTFDPDYRL